jgi:hypothetical protein
MPGLPRAFSPPPLSPPDGNNDADDQRSVKATMEPLSEDDRPCATQSALSSSPRREGRRTPCHSRDHAAARSGASAPSSLVVVIGGRGAHAAPVSGRGGSSGIGSGGGDNDIGFGMSIVCMCGVCVSVRKCRLQYVAEHNVRHNHAYFYFWHGSCQTCFLAAKTTFGSWHAGMLEETLGPIPMLASSVDSR